MGHTFIVSTPSLMVLSAFSFVFLLSGPDNIGMVTMSFQIVLPPHLERIREKLAENIHELWAVTRIEQGWTYAAVRSRSLVRNQQ